MTDNEAAQAGWENEGQRADRDMAVFDAKVALLVQEGLRDGLAPWALSGALKIRAKTLDENDI